MAVRRNDAMDFRPLPAIRVLVILVVAAAGCMRGATPNRGSLQGRLSSSVRNHTPEGQPQQPPTRLRPAAVLKPTPPQITNRFGMTFRLVKIDAARAGHRDSFPKSSYYLQTTRLTQKQHTAFRKAAFGEGTYETINWHHNGGHPSEWREWYRYAQALSKFDAKYDYRLPSRSEWVFACRSGYAQSCDKTKPNALGITGLMNTNGFAEPIDELVVRNGHQFGVLMGHWSNNWGVHSGKSKPDCPCDYWTICNPDADDSLNEVIHGRFVLVPKK